MLSVRAPPEDACHPWSCPLALGTPAHEEVLLLLRESAGGGTRVAVQQATSPRGRPLLTNAWWVLGGEGLEEAQALADLHAEAAALEEWRTFRPRWSLTGAAFLSGGVRLTGVGVRVGVRRWGEPHVLTGAALEYELGELRSPAERRGAPAHQLALPFRVELAPWTEFSASTGLPEASLSLFAGPSLLLRTDGEWGPALGYRAGASVQLLHANDGLLLPLLLEGQLQQHGPVTGGIRDLRLLVGVGF